MDFIGKTPIQIENDHCLDDLKKLNTEYEVIDHSVKEGWTRLLLKTQELDPSLENRYKTEFPQCYLQYTFIKEI